MSIITILGDSGKPQQEVIKAFVAPVNAAVQEDESERVEKALWDTWNELIEVASHTPHAEQDNIVQVVRKVQRQPGPSKDDGSATKVWEEDVEWEKMPLLGPALREKWNSAPNNSDSGVSKPWVNLNAFVARLTADYKPSEPFDFSLYGVWALRDAFEETAADKSISPSQLQAASVWLIYAGQVLVEKSQSNFEYNGKTAREGSSLKGKEWRGCSIERWDHWKARLENLDGSQYDQETQQLAERALAEMKKAGQ